MIGQEFQPENFKKFIAKGEMPKAVDDTWINIWEQDKNLNRKSPTISNYTVLIVTKAQIRRWKFLLL